MKSTIELKIEALKNCCYFTKESDDEIKNYLLTLALEHLEDKNEEIRDVFNKIPELNEDLEYGEGWAFFVSDERDISKLRKDSEEWALGWLSAFTDYEAYNNFTSLDNAIYNHYGIICTDLADFINVCNRAINNARASGEFARVPVQNHDNDFNDDVPF
jgi:hypothetical protein